ncbi:MAG TPA: prolyl oligopeptidase family serine peptidase, partial [Rubrivivax sp.]|nr:prolyl oligopeptidase family serine peptidase [Rubrivivax sp.]
IEGYGAYGDAYEPEFAARRLSLLDRGFVVAIAHVRGGSELGQAWYEAGRLEHKHNSFDDFVAVTDHLVQERWADPARLFAEGGSAGGLLMGVVANRAGHNRVHNHAVEQEAAWRWTCPSSTPSRPCSTPAFP